MKLAFVDCVLDRAARQLSRGGKVVPLEPKMYQLLEVLIERHPAVITNAELDELLWPKVYVARTSLTRLVSELRAVLGDSPRSATIIRTVYKTGYSFAAEVKEVGVPPPAIAQGPAAGVSLVWEGQLIHLSHGENIVGRGAECSIVIDAATVSRRHAKFVVAADSVTLEDLESANGTRVNQASISAPAVLKHGDEISLGEERLTLRMRKPQALTTVIVRRELLVRGDL